MFQTYDQTAEFIKDQHIEMIDYKFADLWVALASCHHNRQGIYSPIANFRGWF